MRRLAVFLLLTLGCASARTTDVREAQRAWMDALNSLDEERIVGAFADDATAFFPVAGSKKTNIVPELSRRRPAPPLGWAGIGRR